METSDRKFREEMERDVVFSHAIKAGKRIYYMDVRRTRKDDLYLSITESKKIAPADGDMSQATFEKHKIFLYKEDFSKFIDGLSKAIGYIHANQTNVSVPEPEAQEDADEEAADSLDDMKIDF